ncbi:DUF4864 domain-containing protein [Gloeobacter violaceus]|uniref:Gll1037 protein n=1 Tax=Gloeobacter violaceus (strain ATCC 29082 / PCC 7421) TaxID=251221 RepID=Q7NLT4_GLOVI|nr:DUF4864 domain-containing protein [Gloeobacter violaceus]BAC88978.1 gll1037 [Gloeobacter violaceus PCC 7421]
MRATGVAAMLLLLIGIQVSAVPWALAIPAVPAEFAQSKAALKKQLEAVIQSQLAAFRKGDYAKAYTFASQGIRRRIPAAVFAEMVRSAYPAIARSRSARFGPILDDGDQAVVHVVVEGAEEQATYAYQMIREGRVWKVNSVTEAEPRRPDGLVST